MSEQRSDAGAGWVSFAGIILITGIGWLWFRQALDLPAMAGMGLIMAGVIVINLFSKTVGG